MAVGQELIVTDRSAFIPTERQCLAALCAVADALDRAGARWLRYMRARLARSSLRLEADAEQLGALLAEPDLRHYHLLPSVRGDLLVRLDRHAEARTEFERAASLTQNARERALLLARASHCHDSDGAKPDQPGVHAPWR